MSTYTACLYTQFSPVLSYLHRHVEERFKWGRSWGSVDPIQVKFKAQESPASNHGYQITLNENKSCLSDAIPLKPQQVVTEFAKAIPANFRLHLDAGNAWAWFTHYFHRKTVLSIYYLS